MSAGGARRGSRYVTELLHLKCGPELVRLRVFPNAKEVEESFGAFAAVRRRLRELGRLDLLGNGGVTCLVPGDGTTPRTGATVAMRTAWSVWSIDPRMRLADAQADAGRAPFTRDVERLYLLKMRVEQTSIPTMLLDAEVAVIVAVHSHAALQPMVEAVPEGMPLLVVALPCCVPLEAGWSPSLEYRDASIHTEHNLIRVWDRGIVPADANGQLRLFDGETPPGET